VCAQIALKPVVFLSARLAIEYWKSDLDVDCLRCHCCVGSQPTDVTTFQVRRQISLPISLHCLRVTPQATLTQAGTSKPRDTRRRLTNPANAYPSRFPTVTLRVPTYIHTETRGRPFSTSRECSNSQELNSRNAPSWPSQGLIRQCRCAWESYADGGHLTPLEHVQFMSRFAQCFRKSLHRFPEAAAILDGLVIQPHAESEESILIHSLSEYVGHHIVGGNEMDGDHQA